MSGDVLTTASTFTCQSQGIVKPDPKPRHPLTVNDKSVVIGKDFVGLTVAGCLKQNQPPAAKTCVNVVSRVSSSGGVLTVNGGAEVLTTDGFTGATDGIIPPVTPQDPPTGGALSATADQSFLKGA
ncbi:hypothetical protein [Streptomyces aquilus]|uniref:hypothetical protein n=1 Tax=Streptomyces aquilus TaxID=2548456 RepID=UPI0036D10773